MSQEITDKRLDECVAFVEMVDHHTVCTILTAALGMLAAGVSQTKNEKQAENLRHNLVTLLLPLPPEVAELIVSVVTGEDVSDYNR